MPTEKTTTLIANINLAVSLIKKVKVVLGGGVDENQFLVFIQSGSNLYLLESTRDPPGGIITGPKCFH